MSNNTNNPPDPSELPDPPASLHANLDAIVQALFVTASAAPHATPMGQRFASSPSPPSTAQASTTPIEPSTPDTPTDPEELVAPEAAAPAPDAIEAETLARLQEDFPALFASSPATAPPPSMADVTDIGSAMKLLREQHGGAPEYPDFDMSKEHVMGLLSLLCSVLASISGNSPLGMAYQITSAVLDQDDRIMTRTDIIIEQEDRARSISGDEAKNVTQNLLREVPEAHRQPLLKFAAAAAKHAAVTADFSASSIRNPINDVTGLSANGFFLLMESLGVPPPERDSQELRDGWAEGVIHLLTTTMQMTGVSLGKFGKERLLAAAKDYALQRVARGPFIVHPGRPEPEDVGVDIMEAFNSIANHLRNYPPEGTPF